MGVQGFPTLKIVRPSKTKGKPTVEDYQGARSAKGIVDAVIEKIPNHVKRLKDADYQAWQEESDAPKAILFSDKGTVSALLKAIAIDFRDSISVAQIRDKEKETAKMLNVEKFPTLVLLPGDGKDPVRYDGEMKKEAMVTFLSQAATPNPDPAPRDKKSKSSSTTNKSKASKASSSFSKASASHASEEGKTAKASQTAESLEDESNPTESPNPNVVTDDTPKPVKVPNIPPPIPVLADGLSLQQKCLNSKAGTCILALLPKPEADRASDTTTQALNALREIHHKHSHAKRNLFPFYQLPSSNSQAAALRTKFAPADPDIVLLAINGKRTWYRPYPSSTSFSHPDVENWIDAIRMGDTPKRDVPSGLIMNAQDLPPEPVQIDLDELQEMKESMRGSMPAGVDFELEEVDDEMYASLMAQASGAQGEADAETTATPVSSVVEPDVTISRRASGGANETPISEFKKMTEYEAMSRGAKSSGKDEL